MDKTRLSRKKDRPRRPAAARVVVVGCGNIGSHLVGHLARMREVSALTLVDPDVYEEQNLSCQEISPEDVKQSKVAVQARRLAGLRRSLRITAIPEAVEDVPLGILRADAILACLDSREARRVVNQAAFRLGVPWIDSGIEAQGLLARVNGYLPAPDAPCLECAWDEEDYRTLEQTYPCERHARKAPPTGAPSSLGAAAASLQATECSKLLRREFDQFAAGRQVLLDLRHHKHYVTTYRRSPACRFDHRSWEIDEIQRGPGQLKLDDLLPLASAKLGNCGEVGLSVAEQPFARRLLCRECGLRKDRLRLLGRLGPCPSCGTEFSPAGVESELSLRGSARFLRKTLRSLGFLTGDVITLRAGPGEAHFQIGGALS
jgi:molybdopterin/thiamine biosynthesis adenylyltransferase